MGGPNPLAGLVRGTISASRFCPAGPHLGGGKGGRGRGGGREGDRIRCYAGGLHLEGR